VNGTYRFGDVEVSPVQLTVRRSNGEQKLRLQSFKVLLFLLENRHRVVTKADLAGLWDVDSVSDESLTQCIKEIRKAIGDRTRDSRFIRTVPKIGYQFVARVETNDSTALIPVQEIAESPTVARPRVKAENHVWCILAASALYASLYAVAAFVEELFL